MAMPEFTPMFSMAYLNWFGRRAAVALGWPGVVGIVLLVVSVFYLGKSYVAVDEIARQQQVLADKQKQVALTSAMENVEGAAPSENPEIALTAFYDAFPNKSDLSASLLMLKQKSTQHKVALNQGRYKYYLVANKAQDSHLARYEIKFPITGSYVNVRSFVDDILLALPTLAINELHLQREAVLDRTVNAELSLTLFVKDEL